jgi:hypothetical protein
MTQRLCVLALFIAVQVCLFENCSVTQGQPAPGVNQKTSANSSGTTTDNPMNPVAVSFAKVHANVKVSFCISGSEFSQDSTISASALDPATLPAPTNPFAAGTGFTAFANSPAGSPDFASIFNSVATLEQNMSSFLYIPQLDPNGTLIGQEQLGLGVYQTAVLHLTPGCGLNASLQIQNAAGTFASSEPIDLIFTGSLNVNGTATEAVLDPTNQLNQLSGVTSADQIATRLRGLAGTMQ